MPAVSRAIYEAKVGWNKRQSGYFTLDYSLLDGVDPLSTSVIVIPTFTGQYDDISNWIDAITSQRGRNDILVPMQAGETKCALIDPGYLKNLLANGDFETDTSGWGTGGTSGGAIARSTSQAKYGRWSLAVTCPGAAVGEGTSTNTTTITGLTGGQQYLATLWVYSAAGFRGRFVIQDTIAGAAGNWTALELAIPAGVWTQVRIARTLDGGADGAIMYAGTSVTAPAQATTFYVDGVSFSDGILRKGLLNPKNVDSPLYGLTNDPLNVFRLRATGPDLVALTLSGNEIDDTMRRIGWEGDGRAVESSMGIYPLATNLVPNSIFAADTSTWTTNDGTWLTAGATLTRDAGRAKYGPVSGLVHPVAANQGALAQMGSLSAATYVARTWVYAAKAGTVRVWIGRDDASSYSFSDIVLAAGWNYVGPAAWAAPGGASVVGVKIPPGGTAFDFWIGAVQVEAGSVPTPLVGTYGSTRSRGAGRIQVPSSVLTEVQGWIALRIRPNWPAASPPNSAPIAFEWRETGSGVNQLILYRSGAIGSQWELAGTRNGTGSNVDGAIDTFNAGGLITLVAYWKNAQLGISVNGSAFTTVARGGAAGGAALPSTFELGSRYGSSLWLNGDILWAAAGTGTLVNADAATLNALGNNDPDVTTLGAGSATSLVWQADDGYAEAAAQTESMFLGFLRDLEYQPGTPRSTATLTFNDLLKRLDDANPVIAKTINTTTGGAIGIVLDAIGWTDPAYRQLAVGDAITTFGPFNDDVSNVASGLQIISDLLATELGLFFIAKDGTAIYEDRNARAKKPLLATIANSMQAIGPGSSLDRVINSATYTKTGSTPQTYTDETSRGKYDLRSAGETVSSYLADDLAAMARARYVVALKKDPSGPLWNLQIDNREARLLATALTARISHRIRVDEAETPSPPKDYYIERMETTIESRTRRHTVRYVVSERGPEPFLLDTAPLDGPYMITP